MRKYVDFTADNFNTYSVELLKLFQAVCSEIDAIGKAMATLINPEFKPNDKSNNIYKWWYIIQDEYYVTDSYAGVFKEQREPTIRLSECTHVFCDSFEICAWDNFRIEITRAYYYSIRKAVLWCKHLSLSVFVSFHTNTLKSHTFKQFVYFLRSCKRRLGKQIAHIIKRLQIILCPY